MQLLSYLLVSTVTLSFAAGSEERNLPSVGDLVSGFRTNYHSFPTLRILWARKHEMMDASFKRSEHAAEKYRKESNDASKTPPERAMSLRLYENAKNVLTNPVLRKPSIIFQEFRTDRSSYQMRRFNASDESDLPSGYSFSKRLPADPLNLQTVLAHTRITAYDQSTSEFTFWMGRREGRDYYQAEIGRKNMGDSQGFFPPLGHDSDNRGGILNELDAFFVRPTSQMRVIRTEIKEGVETYVLEHREEYKLAPDFLTRELPRELIAKFPGKLQLYAITTAWVDAKRGFLPLRIEKTAAFFYDGRRLGPPPQLAELLTVFKVQKIGGGGWYPMKGRVCLFNEDPEWTKGPNSMEMLLDNRFHSIPHVIVNMTSWDIHNIETISDTKDMFTFNLPNNTEYYDNNLKKFLFKGDQKAYNDKVLRHRNVPQR
jgi:hypothetical protein